MLLVLLLLPLWLGYLLATRVFRETDGGVVAAFSVTLAAVAMLLGVAYLFHFMPLASATGWTLAACALMSVALFRLPSVVLTFAPPPRAVYWLTLLVAVYVHFNQVMHLDDDNWVAFAVMGLFLKGNYPPHHPLFLDLQLHGHYARSLLVSSLATLLGGDFVTMSWLSIDVVQTLLFPAVFFQLRALLPATEVASSRNRQALLATVFAFFCVNLGSHAGLTDTMEGNCSLVHLIFFSLITMVWRCLQSPRPGRLALTGIVLGMYALVYETHYGLIILTFVAVAGLLYVWEPTRRVLVLRTLAFVFLLSLPISLTVGGQIAYQFTQRLHPPPTRVVGAEVASQSVKIRFPKDRLFQVKLSPGSWQRVSVALSVLSGGRLLAGTDDLRYAAIWTPDFLKLFWLPLYLAPLTVVVLWRARHYAGLTLWASGLVAFAIPAVVDFGPYFEQEYLRWLFAASLGFTVALGFVVALALDRMGGNKVLGRLAVGTFICLNLVGFGNYLYLMVGEFVHMAEGRPSMLTDAGSPWVPDPMGLLMAESRHCVAAGLIKGVFSPADVAASRWIGLHTGPNATMIRNFEEDSYWAKYGDTFNGALAGTTMLGHAVPPTEAETNTPFRMVPDARAFWQTGDMPSLQRLGAQWVFVDVNRAGPDFVERLKQMPELKLGGSFTDASGQVRTVFEVVPSTETAPSR